MLHTAETLMPSAAQTHRNLRIVGTLAFSTILLLSAAAFSILTTKAAVSPMIQGEGEPEIPVFPPPERGLALDWRAEHVVTPRTFLNMGPRCLAVGPNGREHLAYGGDHLYYAYKDGEDWSAPVVVDPDWSVGQATSLAVDSNNKVHISYYDVLYGGARYATNKSGLWVVKSLNSNGFHPYPWTSLALDTEDLPHIIYTMQGTAFEYQDQAADGSWSGAAVGGNGLYGRYPNLAIGSDNKGHAVFFSVSDNIDYLHYYTRDQGGSWFEATEPLTGTVGALGEKTALALDALNRPHIIYRGGGALFHWGYNGAWWVNEFVGAEGGMTSITNVVDTGSQVHLAWRKSTLSYLQYLLRDAGGTWSGAEAIEEVFDAGEGVSLALDSDQHPRASFYRREDYTLRYRAKEGVNWHTGSTLKLVDTRGADVGECTGLVLAADGTAHLTYFDATSKAIRYTRKSGSTWEMGLDDVVTSGSPNCRHSLAIKSTGSPGVAYTNEDGELHYAFWGCYGTCGWLDQLVSIAAFVPESVSLAYDLNNKPVISYNYNSMLYFAYLVGSIWTTSQVDNSIISGQTSLVVDPGGHPQIAYFRSTNDLYYAKGSATSGAITWDKELADGNNAGGAVSLKVNFLGWPMIAYTGTTSGLRYIVKGIAPGFGYIWTTPVTVTPVSGIDSLSMGIDPSMRKFIAYEQGVNLMLAKQEGMTWSTQTLDAIRPSGHGLSLAISPLTGIPHISYYDGVNQDVKYVYQVHSVLLPVVKR